MYNYMKDTDFLESVSREDFNRIKSIIVTRVIKACNWNKEKINEIINYAERKCNFTFQKHIDYDKSGIKIGTREEYNFEIGKLNDNFSKERYSKILQMAKELNLIRNEETKEKENKTGIKKDSKEKKIEKEKSYLKDYKHSTSKSYLKKNNWNVILGVGVVVAIGIYLVVKSVGD